MLDSSRAALHWGLGVFVTVLFSTVGQPASDSGISRVSRATPFAFGVEYMVPGLAKIYAATGATWAKPQPEGWNWACIEPSPPRNGKHTYDWSWTDMLMCEYQDAGFSNFHVYTQARSPWASSKPLPPVGNSSFIPKPEYRDDYALYLKSLVERYDRDGKDDMPGLRYPVRYWEIEAEWGTFWPGTVADYITLLRIAREAIREADPQARIILQGFLLMGLFDGDPDARELKRRLSQAPHVAKAQKLLPEVRELLRHPELFDIVEFHSLGDWTEIIGTTRWLRNEMRALGYEKPIWAGDVNLSLNPMIWWNKPFYPYAPHQRTQILRWIEAMKKQNSPDHPQAVRWFRAEQASFTAKKIVCAIGEGLAGINMGNLEDWPVFGIVHGITGTSAFCGLIDTEGLAPTKRKPQWAWGARIPGNPRPAYWTMKLLIERLGPYLACDRLSLGRGIFAYRFCNPSRGSHRPSSTTVLWLEDGKGQLPGDPEPCTELSLATAASGAELVPIITRIGQKEADAQSANVVDGRIKVVVSETPLLVEEK